MHKSGEHSLASAETVIPVQMQFIGQNIQVSSYEVRIEQTKSSWHRQVIDEAHSLTLLPWKNTSSTQQYIIRSLT